MDPRYRQLAQLLVTHSTRLQPGEHVLIEATHIPPKMVEALVEAAVEKGAIPVVETKFSSVVRKLLSCGSTDLVKKRLQTLGDIELYRMKKMQAYIGLRGSLNITELSDVPAEHMRLYEEHLVKPVHIDRRVNHTKWVVLRWPGPSMAQQANLATEAFEDFYFQACLADYAAMDKAVKPLKELMEKTDQVRLTGPGTDLRFSIQGMPAVPCCGEFNIPDGECFTAPVKDSVEGTIQYNAATIYRGKPFDNIRLTFKKGRVVEFSSSDDQSLGEILDSDEGARYLGEFAIGFHPFISEPMRDILFDEKIRGSVHLALGQAYDDADNGNKSRVHWDMVLLQESGGELYFDERLIRKDGRFVVPELEALNPENLGAERPAVLA